MFSSAAGGRVGGKPASSPHATLTVAVAWPASPPLPLSQGWNCTQVFEGHSHYVMQVSFNPKDTNTFASASLDRTIKVSPPTPSSAPRS